MDTPDRVALRAEYDRINDAGPWKPTLSKVEGPCPWEAGASKDGGPMDKVGSYVHRKDAEAEAREHAWILNQGEGVT